MSDDKINDKIDGEKKIIIDEDWKSQVEAEKEAARIKQQQGQAEQPAVSEEALLAPTLTFLASTIYMQGAIAMGLLPNPLSDKQSSVQIDQARHAIDLLSMLQLKTEGNRTPEETEELEGMLHQLRLAYITVTQK
jgi:hypothetical protein